MTRVSRASLVGILILASITALYASDPCALTPDGVFFGELKTYGMAFCLWPFFAPKRTVLTLSPQFSLVSYEFRSRLRTCFLSIPLQKEQGEATLNAMDSLVDLYSFTDLARDSGAPYNIKVDLRSNLAQFRQKLNNGGYTNDYEFQSDLMNTMNLLLDAHTLYRGPAGYRCFFSRPFNLDASYNNNNTLSYTLRLGPLGAAGDELWRSTFGINPADFVGQVITSINGKSVTDHVIGVAHNFIAAYKDEAVRFNAALRGRWSQTLLNVFPITDPNLDYDATYVFADGRTVTIPNAAYCAIGPKSTEDLIKSNSAASAPSTASAPRRTLASSPGFDIHREHDKLFEDAVAALPVSLKRLNARATKAASIAAGSTHRQTINIHDYTGVHAAVGSEFHDVSGFEVPVRQIYANYDVSNLKMITSVNNDTFFLKYRDGINAPIWIFKLTTFHPKNEIETLNVLNTLLVDAEASGASHLIVDVAYNGGGLVCLSDLMIAMLVPEWRNLHDRHSQGTPFGIYDYKLSKTAIALRFNASVDKEYTAYSNYLDLAEKPATTSFYNPVTRTRAGSTSNYTQQALFPAECTQYPETEFTPVNFYFKSVTILTDGTCGSACALFASQLQANKKATVVSYGGILGRTIPLSTASFAGGNVLAYEVVAQNASYDKAPGLPPLMTSTATARFNFNEFYEVNDLETPREFLKRPAQFHLDFYATLYSSNPFTAVGLASYAALYNAVAHIF